MRFLKPSTSGYMTTERNGVASRYLTIAHADALNLGTAAALPDFSVSVHINPQTPSNTWNIMVSKASASGGYDYSIYWHLTGSEFRVYCIMKNSVGQACYGSWYAADGTMWSANTWVHLVLCWDPGGASVAASWKCFFDGEKIEDNGGCSGQFGTDGIYTNTGTNFTIGGRGDGSATYPHDFHYRDFSVWSEFLSDAKAKELQRRHPVKGEQGLVCYWPLAHDFRDRGGVNGYDLGPYYAGYLPTLTSGKRSEERRSFSFSQSTDWTTSASADGINAARAADDSAWAFGDADFTLEFWWAMCEMDESTERVISVWNTTDNRAFHIERIIYSGGSGFKLYYSSDGSATVSTKIQYHTNTIVPSLARASHCVWTHFAVAFDYSQVTPKAQCNFYVDSVLQTTASGNTSFEDGGAGDARGIYDGTAQLVLGNHDAANDLAAPNFDGRICELRMWSDLRLEAEIIANYNKQIAPDTAGLVGYWPGHPNSSGQVVDVTSNANHLTTDGAGVKFSNTHPFL